VADVVFNFLRSRHANAPPLPILPIKTRDNDDISIFSSMIPEVTPPAPRLCPTAHESGSSDLLRPTLTRARPDAVLPTHLSAVGPTCRGAAASSCLPVLLYDRSLERALQNGEFLFFSFSRPADERS